MLAEWAVAGKRAAMRRLLALLLLLPMLAMAPRLPAAAGRCGQDGCDRRPAGASRPGLGPLGTADAVFLQNVAQGLVSFDASGNIVGGLAERWNVSDDGLSYIFRLASANGPTERK